jgi:EmrB/QacA subfamily drug resistance transporter
MNAVPRAHPGAGPLPRWRVFPALALGTLMAVLDISIVNMALPTLSRTFHAPLTSVEWVVLAYVVTITGLLLTLGRIADHIGRRRVYGTGLVGFVAASVLCAAAPSAGWLVAFRAVQGLGAAMMTANSTALLVSNFPPDERGRALGAFGALVGVGLALGPPLGGLIVSHASWRWIFLVNVPLGMLALTQLRARVPDDPGDRDAAPPGLVSAGLWCGTLVTAMLALSRGPAVGWRAPAVLALAGASVALLVAFAGTERAARLPLLPLDLLRTAGAAATLTLIGNALSISVGFHLPMYFAEVPRYGATRSGLLLAVVPVLALFMAPLAGRWSDRVGPRALSIVGLMVACVGFVLLAGIGVTPPTGRLIGALALVGGGLGLFTVPNTSALFGVAGSARTGTASGLQATMRNLGIAGGAAAMAAMVASRYRHLQGGVLAAAGHADVDRAAYASATRDAFLAMAVLAAIGAVLATRQRDPRAPGPM